MSLSLAENVQLVNLPASVRKCKQVSTTERWYTRDKDTERERERERDTHTQRETETQREKERNNSYK